MNFTSTRWNWLEFLQEISISKQLFDEKTKKKTENLQPCSLLCSSISQNLAKSLVVLKFELSNLFFVILVSIQRLFFQASVIFSGELFTTSFCAHTILLPTSCSHAQMLMAVFHVYFLPTCSWVRHTIN